MAMLEQQGVANHRWAWMFGPFIILGAIVSFLIPIVAPVIAVALIASGIVAYRQNTDKAVRALAVAAIASGVVIILAIVFGGLIFLPVSTTTSVTEGAIPAILP